MTLDDSTCKWLGQLLGSRPTEVLDRWIDVESATLQSRRSRAELEADLRELLDVFTAGLDRGDDFAEMRAVLAELSRNRARQGFSPTETATTVFSLKRAVLDVAGASAETALHQLAFSDLVDQLGLLHLRPPGSRGRRRRRAGPRSRAGAWPRRGRATTDGLLDRRDLALDVGLDLMARTITDHHDDLTQLCARLIADVGPDGDAPDDIAILAIRRREPAC